MNWVFVALVIGAAGMAALVGWLRGRRMANAALRSTVKSLTSTLESITDALVVVSPDGSIERYNAQFSRLFRADNHLTFLGKPFGALPGLVEVVDVPELFAAQIDQVADRPGRESEDTIAFRDGRVFERRSRPSIVDDAVVGRVWTFRDVTNVSRLMHELSHSTMHDSVTGLANRGLMLDRLEHALSRARRTLATVAVLEMDLDGFDVINNTLGRETGDQLLVAFARRLRLQIRESDTIARLGAHEFAIVVDQTSSAGAIILAGRIRAMLEEPFLIGGHEVYARVSIGLADNANDALDADELLRRADTAMHSAKTMGGDRFEIFDDTMHADLMERQELYHDLRNALRADELRVYYQPRIDLATNDVESLEALLRWRHPVHGLVGPAQILPVAEETGLIIEIGRWVLNEACRQLMEWSEFLGEHVTISVNISPRQLYDDGFIDDVARALADSGVPGHRLILELNESSLLANMAVVEERLVKLRALHVHVAIDDFGVGYSSLTYLQSVSMLKIDRKFVQGYTDDQSDRGGHVVRSMLGMAQNFGIGVVAEGIEEEGELATFRGLGCEAGQGYLFAPPLPADQIPLVVTRLNRAPAIVVAPRADTPAFDESN